LVNLSLPTPAKRHRRFLKNDHGPYHERMLKSPIRSVLVVTVAWIVLGPWWAWALDAIHAKRMATVTSFSIRQFSGYFTIYPGRHGGEPLPEAERFRWVDWGNPLQYVDVRLDPGGVLVLIDGERRFVLGTCPCATADHGYTPPIEPDPGDTVSITLDRSLASWPTPYDVGLNWLGGSTFFWYPWERYLYWHLSWVKVDGARLDMFARFVQFYKSGDGWQYPVPPSLQRLEIRPAHRDGRAGPNRGL
jgi:hypothetical protein